MCIHMQDIKGHLGVLPYSLGRTLESGTPLSLQERAACAVTICRAMPPEEAAPHLRKPLVTSAERLLSKALTEARDSLDLRLEVLKFLQRKPLESPHMFLTSQLQEAMADLRAVTPPQLTWRFHAPAGVRADIASFLESDETQRRFRGFARLREAKDCAAPIVQVCGRKPGNLIEMRSIDHSIRVVIRGPGSSSCLEIYKRDVAYKAAAALHAQRMATLAELDALTGAGPLASAAEDASVGVAASVRGQQVGGAGGLVDEGATADVSSAQKRAKH